MLGMRAIPTAAGAVTLVAAGVAISGAPPAGEAVSLALACLVALGGWSAPLLGLLATLAAASTTGTTLPTPLEWTALVATGLAIGLVARHVEEDVPRLTGVRALGTGIWLALGAAVVALLPADFLQLLDATGAPLMLQVGLADPASAARALVGVPAAIPHERPLAGLLAMLPVLGVASAFLLALAGSRDAGWRVGWGAAIVVGACAVAAGTAGLVELLTGSGTDALPGAADWVVELGWLSGGAIGTSPGPLPSEAWLGLASRPVVDALLVGVGLALGGLGVLHLRRLQAPSGLADPGPVTWHVPLVIAAVACGVVAAAAGLPGGSGWTALAGVLFLTAALLGSFFRAGHGRLGSDLQVLAAVTWVFGLLAPLAGWLAP